jgi:hypothetical protein
MAAPPRAAAAAAGGGGVAGAPVPAAVAPQLQPATNAAAAAGDTAAAVLPTGVQQAAPGAAQGASPAASFLAGMLPLTRDWREVERGMVLLARRVQVSIPGWVLQVRGEWEGVLLLLYGLPVYCTWSC